MTSRDLEYPMKLSPEDVNREDLTTERLNDSSFRVIHEPTGKFVAYNIPPFARDMRYNDQVDLAKDKICREGFEYNPDEAV